jgi:hypothetical protein
MKSGAGGERPVRLKRDSVVHKAKPIGNRTRRSSEKERAVEAPQNIEPEGARTAQIELIRIFGRVERMAEKIDQAFGGEPFLPDLAPDDPANLHRFYAFFNQHARVSRLLFRAIEAWMITCI